MATIKKAAGNAVRPAPHIAHLPASKKAEDPTVQTYRCLSKLLIADEDGSVHYRYYGDFIPEAAGWKNLSTYLRQQQLETCFVNQSELDANIDAMRQRFAEEDSEKEAQKSIDDELMQLEQQRLALLAKKEQRQNGVNPNPSEMFNGSSEPKNVFTDEKTKVEKIDFGGVRKGAALQKKPTPTRAVPAQKNVGENRTRVLKKKG
jgi:hypothetical protein